MGKQSDRPALTHRIFSVRSQTSLGRNIGTVYSRNLETP